MMMMTTTTTRKAAGFSAHASSWEPRYPKSLGDSEIS
jgi:hypothetical protein